MMDGIREDLIHLFIQIFGVHNKNRYLCLWFLKLM